MASLIAQATKQQKQNRVKPQAPTQLGAPSAKSLGLGFGSKTPYDPLGQPKTEGAFNKRLYQAAQSQYLPQLQGVAGDVNSENTANKMRVSGLTNIYGAAQKQAQDAFDQAKGLLTGIISSKAASDATSRTNLAAALQSAAGNSNALSAMMGGVTTGKEVDPGAYQSALLGDQAIGNQSLTNAATAASGEFGQFLADPGIEQAQMKNQESQRHQAAGVALTGARDAIIKQIPSIIEKTRQDLISSLQSAEGLSFQQDLATKQFGQAAQQQKFTQGLQTQQLGEQKKVDSANIQHQTNQDELTKLLAGNTIAKDNAALTNELNKAKSDAEKNALIQLTSWVAPTPNELTPKKTVYTTDPSTGQRTASTQQGGTVNPKTWHRDVGAELDLLVTQFGLTQQRALQLMYGLTTPIGGKFNGEMTIGQWAKTFYQRQKANRTGNIGGIVGGAAKGLGKTVGRGF